MTAKNLAGFTLIETLSVMVIAAVLSSILYPVLARAVLASRESSAIQRLHQLHAGLMMYQADYDGGGRYGTAEQMGLPTSGQLLESGVNLIVVNDASMWKSPCGTHPDRMVRYVANGTPIDRPDYVYYPEGADQDPDGQMARYFLENAENAFLLSDTNCFDHSLPLFKGVHRRNLIGAALDGHVETRWTWAQVDLWSNWTR